MDASAHPSNVKGIKVKKKIQLLMLESSILTLLSIMRRAEWGGRRQREKHRERERKRNTEREEEKDREREGERQGGREKVESRGKRGRERILGISVKRSAISFTTPATA